MAKPITANRFLYLLDLWDIPYIQHRPNWATHNRNHKGLFDDVRGVMIHHTGSDNQKDMPGTLWNGYDGLPGPLCHGGVDEKGRVILTGWGRCNHAGNGDPDVLAKVTSENYKGILVPKYTNDSINAVDGNRRFYGFEFMYSGSHAMSLKQNETATKLSAALCTEHKWSAKSVIGHGEWQKGKWDPGIQSGKMMDMDAKREVIQLRIKAGPAAKPPSGVKPYTVRKGESLYKIAREQLGDEKLWVNIVEANPKLFPLTILPGTEIKLPKK